MFDKAPVCCGEEKYKDCNGNYRCQMCEKPCSCCDDGGMQAWFDKPTTQVWVERTMQCK
jgi:hypothetical protein